MDAEESASVKVGGTEFVLRWTAAALRRIKDKFGSIGAIDEDPTNVVEALYLLSYDEDGKPPEGMTLDRWMNSCSMQPDAMREYIAVLGAAISGKGKNEVRAMVEEAQAEQEKSTGSDSMPSPINASDSTSESSGMDTPSTKSMTSSLSGGNEKTPKTIVPASLPLS